MPDQCLPARRSRRRRSEASHCSRPERSSDSIQPCRSRPSPPDPSRHALRPTILRTCRHEQGLGSTTSVWQHTSQGARGTLESWLDAHPSRSLCCLAITSCPGRLLLRFGSTPRGGMRCPGYSRKPRCRGRASSWSWSPQNTLAAPCESGTTVALPPCRLAPDDLAPHAPVTHTHPYARSACESVSTSEGVTQD